MLIFTPLCLNNFVQHFIWELFPLLQNKVVLFFPHCSMEFYWKGAHKWDLLICAVHLTCSHQLFFQFGANTNKSEIEMVLAWPFCISVYIYIYVSVLTQENFWIKWSSLWKFLVDNDKNFNMIVLIYTPTRYSSRDLVVSYFHQHFVLVPFYFWRIEIPEYGLKNFFNF